MAASFAEQDFKMMTSLWPQWLRCTGPEFYYVGIQVLVPRWSKAVDRDADYVDMCNSVPKKLYQHTL
jgi:hypothetical protein